MLTLDVAGGMVVVNNQCVMVTDEPTPTDEPYSLVVDTLCPGDGSTLFIISNNGGDMTEPVHYVVADMNGAVVDDGWVQLMAGESFSLQELATGMLTLDVAGGMVVVNNQCVMVTDEPTPTDEPYSLAADTLCPGDGSTLFIISNNGGDMTEPVYYVVTDMNGAVVDDGWVQLMAGESFSLQEWGAGMLTLDVAGGMVVVNNQCVMVTDEPTPTEEVTPPPEETPTPVPTEPPTLACQKNNPDRLDCSSLQVTAVCEGDTAVFTISNTGEAGNGDMRVPTEYRILVDGTVVESGSVQLTGGETTQIIYSGGGTVTLEADQQIGHPGNSLPQATVSCST
ncbi:MAG: hypothetical protein R3E39_28940 [Anaerolineae bacterium]